MRSLCELLKEIDQRRDEISALRPFKDWRTLEEIKNFFDLEQTFSSNAIEGYSYTSSETAILINLGLTAGGKPLCDALAVEGLRHAYKFMFEIVQKGDLTEENLKIMHTFLSGSLRNDGVAGKYRNCRVFASGYEREFLNYKKIDKEIQKLIYKYNVLKGSTHPVVLAAKFHKDFVFIHPFADGNGRIARLAMNCILIKNELLPVAIPPINRNIYIDCLEKAWVNDQKFIKFIAESELNVQKDYLRMIRSSDLSPNMSPSMSPRP